MYSTKVMSDIRLQTEFQDIDLSGINSYLISVSICLSRINMKYLTLLIFLLVLADGLISKFLTGNGLGQEINPFLQTIISSNNFLLLKAAGSLFVGLLLWDIFKRQPRIAFIVAASCVVFYTGILYWNLAVFFISGY